MADSPKLDLALAQIASARDYTKTLLADVAEDEWFEKQAGVSHLAWQVGHLTMAQYMLTLFRVRGKVEADAELAPKPFLRKFLKGTEPQSSGDYPPIEEILGRFDRVHKAVLTELAGYRDDQLQGDVVEPFAAEKSQLGSILFCAHHEMLHAGQIGLIRRLLGKPPIR